MITGYTRPLYLLPFDHRASYISGLFMRRKSCHLNQNQLALSPQKPPASPGWFFQTAVA